jgi:hypothetical protein
MRIQCFAKTQIQGMAVMVVAAMAGRRTGVDAFD